PFGAVPDLDMVVNSRHDDLLVEAGVLPQMRRNEDTTLAVELGDGRSREDEALHLARLSRERIQLCDPPDVVVPAPAREDVDVALDAPRENHATRERVPVLRRQREPVLLVDRVLVLAVEHVEVVDSPTDPHLTPLFPT